jgi:ribonuclease HI
MIVTINTDASFSEKYKIGTYAFWIVCNNFKIQKFGALKLDCQRAEEAEIRAILNALHTIKFEGNITKVIVNTDCLNAIHILTNDQPRIQRYRLYFGKPYRKYFNKNFSSLWREIEFRHVKAHTDTDTSRTWVNDWCDKKAKQQLNEKINGTLKNKNGSDNLYY